MYLSYYSPLWEYEANSLHFEHGPRALAYGRQSHLLVSVHQVSGVPTS